MSRLVYSGPIGLGDKFRHHQSQKEYVVLKIIPLSLPGSRYRNIKVVNCATNRIHWVSAEGIRRAYEHVEG